MSAERTYKLKEIPNLQICVIKTPEGHYYIGCHGVGSINLDDNSRLRSFDEVKEQLVRYIKEESIVFLSKPSSWTVFIK
ncbi:hypothetical protein HYX16_04760 [Candidatus Woesearchaeota archaeon]|nr:hypothetical protein [Candidatus Woesearchaeota archaeon]